MSNSWKALCFAFSVVGSLLAWNIGNGSRVAIGEDPWIGGVAHFKLSNHVINALRSNGFFTLNQVGVRRVGVLEGQA